MPPLPRSTIEESFLCPTCKDFFDQPDDTWDLWDSGWRYHYAGDLEDLVVATRSNCRLCKMFWSTASVSTLSRVFSLDKRRGRGRSWGIYCDVGTATFAKLNLESEYFQLLPIACMSHCNLRDESFF